MGVMLKWELDSWQRVSDSRYHDAVSAAWIILGIHRRLAIFIVMNSTQRVLANAKVTPLPAIHNPTVEEHWNRFLHHLRSGTIRSELIVMRAVTSLCSSRSRHNSRGVVQAGNRAHCCLIEVPMVTPRTPERGAPDGVAPVSRKCD